VLFLLLRTPIGAQGAKLAALLLTAVLNTGANRRLTFGIRGSRHAARSQLEGLAVFGLGLLLSSGALAVLHAVVPAPSRSSELFVLVTANLVATVLRFLAYRAWVFAPRRHRREQMSTDATSACIPHAHIGDR
jgi:putative flippase GtrA